MAEGNTLLQTNLTGFDLVSRGKVRDIYAVGPIDGQDALLIVATDRISAFDYILATGIPTKGEVLTRISMFWFHYLRDLVPNHVITADIEKYPEALKVHRSQIEGRSMLVRRAKMIDVECVARGYISGSGWKDYQKTGSICGISLPQGLGESDALPEPIFTPATKAQSGHDENISFEHAAEVIGPELAAELRNKTLAIYRKASAYARGRGIILADTKFEFGFIDGVLTLADEALTPDSSRFWPADQYKPGGPQPSFDKQYVRDYLESIHWNKRPPAPALPPEVAARTGEKYREAYERLTGERF